MSVTGERPPPDPSSGPGSDSPPTDPDWECGGGLPRTSGGTTGPLAVRRRRDLPTHRRRRLGTRRGVETLVEYTSRGPAQMGNWKC